MEVEVSRDKLKEFVTMAMKESDVAVRLAHIVSFIAFQYLLDNKILAFEDYCEAVDKAQETFKDLMESEKIAHA